VALAESITQNCAIEVKPVERGRNYRLSSRKRQSSIRCDILVLNAGHVAGAAVIHAYSH